MADFIVNESAFLIDDDLYESSFVPAGFMLPDGIIFGEKLDEAPSWELYASEDMQFDLLVIKPQLAEKWLEQHLLPQHALLPMSINQSEYYLLISPTSLKLKRVTQLRFNGSVRYALAFFSALQHTRSIDAESSLRDALYCELYSVMLPCYTWVPTVADRALFRNALRGKNDEECLLTPEEMGGGGLAYFSLKQELKAKGIAMSDEQPLLEPGEPIDDFFSVKGAHQIVTGPLVIRRQYQVFDTSSGSYLILIDRLWGDALLHTSLLSQISLNSIPIYGKSMYVMTMPKRTAVESMDDRHSGFDKYSMMDLAQAIRRTRAMVPNADLQHALYVEKLGVLLPLEFNAETHDDGKLMWSVIQEGPFSISPLLEDIAYDILSVARGSD